MEKQISVNDSPKVFRRIRLVFELVLIMDLLFLVKVYADPYQIYFTKVNQQQTNWCWAASAENSVRSQMTPAHTQADAVHMIKGNSNMPYPNVSGSTSDIKTAAQYISNYTKTYSTSGVKSYYFLEAEISNGQAPVIVESKYLSGNPSHAVCMYGYNTTPSNTFVMLYDPWVENGFVHEKSYPYNDYVAGSYLSCNGYKYLNTVYVD